MKIFLFAAFSCLFMSCTKRSADPETEAFRIYLASKEGKAELAESMRIFCPGLPFDQLQEQDDWLFKRVKGTQFAVCYAPFEATRGVFFIEEMPAETNRGVYVGPRGSAVIEKTEFEKLADQSS